MTMNVYIYKYCYFSLNNYPLGSLPTLGVRILQFLKSHKQYKNTQPLGLFQFIQVTDELL